MVFYVNEVCLVMPKQMVKHAVFITFFNSQV